MLKNDSIRTAQLESRLAWTRAGPCRRRSSWVPFAAAGLLASTAMGDDASKSQHLAFVDADWGFLGAGSLIIEDTTAPAGINNGPGEDKNPATFHSIVGHAGHWKFDVWYVTEWGTLPGGVKEGAKGAKVGIRGEHIRAPHGEAPNPLPAVLGGESVAGLGKAADIPYNSGAILAVWASDQHEEHWDSYGVLVSVSAYDKDGWTLGAPRQMRGTYDIKAYHGETKVESPWTFQDGTLGSSPRAGASASYDPATRTLRLEMGRVDILDAEGGRTGGIAPDYAKDPLAGMEPVSVVMEYAGFDPERETHVFKGGEFFVSNPEAEIQIAGQVGEYCLTSTTPGASPGNLGIFNPIWVSDTADPAAWRSTWAERFVQQGWFGKGLTPGEQAQRLFPVLTFTTDKDLVEATSGFREAAKLPATVLLTVVTDPEAGPRCYADCDGDGALTFFDFLCFQDAFASGSPAADCDVDGALTFFDFLCFQNAFAAGCP